MDKLISLSLSLDSLLASCLAGLSQFLLHTRQPAAWCRAMILQSTQEHQNGPFQQSPLQAVLQHNVQGKGKVALEPSQVVQVA